MNKLEGILDWFFGIMDSDAVKPFVNRWLDAAHAKAAMGEAACKCDLHRALHAVMHLLSEKNKTGILEGTPWIHAAFWTQVEDFLTSTWPVPPDLTHTLLVLTFRAERQKVVTENHLQVPIDPISSGTRPFSIAQLNTIKDFGGVIKALAKSDVGELKALPSHDDEDEGDEEVNEGGDSDDDSDENISSSESDSDDEDDHEDSTNEDMMNTDKTNKGPMDKTISTMPVGLEILKDGVRIEPPPGTTYTQVITALQRQAEEEEQTISIHERVDAFVLEGAVAFQAALKEEVGWVQKGEDKSDMPSFLTMLFGAPPASPVTTLSVQTSLTTTEQVVWDDMRVPGMSGFLRPGFEAEDGRFFFLITGEVKRKHEARARKIVETTRRIVRERSIYKGHALELDLPERGYDVTKHAPRFMKGLDAIDPRGMIFSRKLEQELETYVFGIIRRTKLLARLGVSAHRGALFMGPPGTGKTLAAGVTAKIAEENGWTFFYVKKPDQIVPMYKLAASYGDAERGSILFVEDVDQSVQKNDEDVDDAARTKFRALLNVLDGVDTKGAKVFVIFTTNKDPRNFDTAFTRESRLDSIINFTPPDQEAVERLLRWYLGAQLDSTANLSTVSAQLAGLRPATIKEVAAKSILGAAQRLPLDVDPDHLPDGIINEEDLLVAARVAKEQLELAKPLEKTEEPDSDEERAAVFLGKHIQGAVTMLTTTLERFLPPDHKSNGHTKAVGSAHAPPALSEPTRTS